MAANVSRVRRRPRRVLWGVAVGATVVTAASLWPTMAVELRLPPPVGPAPAGDGEEA